jgi:hypothetical protein
MNVLGKIKLLHKLNKVFGAVEKVDKESKNMYEWKTTLTKVAKDFVITSGSVAVGAVLLHFSDPVVLGQLLSTLPAQVSVLVVPLASSAVVGALNWWKNRNK